MEQAMHNACPDRARRGATIEEGRARQITIQEPARATLMNSSLSVGAEEGEFHPSRIVSISLDGASVNLGEKSGVGALLKKENPSVVVVHGVAQNNELSWADALIDIEMIGKVVRTNQEACTFYGGSANKRLSYTAVSDI